MSIFCVGQSAYDITIPLKEPLVENRNTGLPAGMSAEADRHSMRRVCAPCGALRCS